MTEQNDQANGKDSAARISDEESALPPGAGDRHGRRRQFRHQYRRRETAEQESHRADESDRQQKHERITDRP